MTAEVVPAEIRGLAFSETGFLRALVSAASPLAIVGALVVLRGRRYVAADTTERQNRHTAPCPERRIRGLSMERVARSPW